MEVVLTNSRQKYVVNYCYIKTGKLLGAIVKGLKRPDFTHFKNELTTTDFNKIVRCVI